MTLTPEIKRAFPECNTVEDIKALRLSPRAFHSRLDRTGVRPACDVWTGDNGISVMRRPDGTCLEYVDGEWEPLD
jgi:hypothetical protein